ncbi:hypothetical protein MRBLBA71_001536 [Bacillus nitratireducens]|uniref:DUF6037 family protein n=1 Tax=Bacillus nitratireducens TaxID=2026193 RepID=UPI003465202B
MAILGNLKVLKSDMEEKGWFIDAFLFTYKQQDYIVLVKLYTGNQVKPEGILLKLEFLRRGNINDKLLVPASASSFKIDAKTFRDYFGIKYEPNLWDVFQQFYRHFSTFIPTEVNEKKPRDQENAMLNSLSEDDNDDPNKRYCYAFNRNGRKANGEYKKRSSYNDNKAKILFRDLYEEVKDEKHASFWFSVDKNDLKTKEEILANWAKNRDK